MSCLKDYNYMRTSAVLMYRAEDIAQKILQNIAIDIVKQNPDIKEVVMAMGMWNFWITDDIFLSGDDPRTKKFLEAVLEYEKLFGCTYGPWRYDEENGEQTRW